MRLSSPFALGGPVFYIYAGDYTKPPDVSVPARICTALVFAPETIGLGVVGGAQITPFAAVSSDVGIVPNLGAAAEWCLARGHSRYVLRQH